MTIPLSPSAPTTPPDSLPVVVAALYRFVELADCERLRERLTIQCQRLGIKGTLLLAQEGINGTLSGSRLAIDTFLTMVREDPRLADLTYRIATTDNHPFQRLKVRVKREIVTLDQAQADPREKTAQYIDPKDWNALVKSPDVQVIDTRNRYEFAIGHFAGAVDPGTDRFRDFPAFAQDSLGGSRQRKIALYCTGGIRCEKAGAFLLSQGYEQVYQLKGGILAYLDQVQPEHSLWQGECFVFDGRVSLGHGLKTGRHRLCTGCGWALPLTTNTARDEDCPRCHPDNHKKQF